MKPLPHNADLLGVATHIIWFEPPERALADPVRFLVHLMTYGTIAEIAVVRRYIELDDFREALDRAPPGIMDERSWAYSIGMPWPAATRPRPCRVGSFLEQKRPQVSLRAPRYPRRASA
jgi:hypothetical protein